MKSVLKPVPGVEEAAKKRALDNFFLGEKRLHPGEGGVISRGGVVGQRARLANHHPLAFIEKIALFPISRGEGREVFFPQTGGLSKPLVVLGSYEAPVHDARGEDGELHEAHPPGLAAPLAPEGLCETDNVAHASGECASAR